MVPDDDDIKDGLKSAETDPKRAALLPEPIPDKSSYRSCNGCYALQTRPLIPSVAEWKLSWVNPEPEKAKSKKAKRGTPV